MKIKPKFPFKESREPKREEKREAKMPKAMMKRVEAQEGQHFKKGGKAGKRGC